MDSIDKLYQAIKNRHSRRKYTGDRLAQEVVASLSSLASELNQSLNGARVVFVNENPDHVLKGIVGSYGKITGAPAYVAFIANTEDVFHQEKTGYLGEKFILEATVLELGTCWVGGFFNPEAVAKDISINRNEKVLAVSPVGLVEKQYSFVEKIFSGLAKGHSRKALKDLYLESNKDQGPNWVRGAMEAARLAPSAVNRQPWRFTVEAKGIKISIDSPKNIYKISKRLDCGIAMAHVEIAANYTGVEGQWEYLDEPDVARFMV
jgi:nitroreductase